MSKTAFITNTQTEELVRLVILMMQISEQMDPLTRLAMQKGKVQGKETIQAFPRVKLCYVQNMFSLVSFLSLE